MKIVLETQLVFVFLSVCQMTPNFWCGCFLTVTKNFAVEFHVLESHIFERVNEEQDFKKNVSGEIRRGFFMYQDMVFCGPHFTENRCGRQADNQI